MNNVLVTDLQLERLRRSAIENAVECAQKACEGTGYWRKKWLSAERKWRRTANEFQKLNQGLDNASR